MRQLVAIVEHFFHVVFMQQSKAYFSWSRLSVDVARNLSVLKLQIRTENPYAKQVRLAAGVRQCIH